MNFWSLDQKIWEGFKQTDDDDRRRQTTDYTTGYLIVTDKQILFVGDKKSEQATSDATIQ